MNYKKILELKKYEQAKNNFYWFYKFAWGIVDPANYMDNWHIELICEHLQAQYEGVSELKKIIISIQPRVSKSLICSVCYPAWIWLHKPQTNIISISHTQQLAKELAIKSRDLIQSSWYSYWTLQEDIFKLKADNNKQENYNNDKLGKRLASSPGSAIIGFGADQIIIDDPNSTDSLYSKVKQDAVINYYKTTLRNRINSASEGKWLLIQQRLGENDLTQYFLDNESDWFHLKIPTEFTKHYTFSSPIGLNDPRKQEGELLWKARFPASWYKDEKKNPYIFATIYQQEPIARQGNIIREEWLKYYNTPQDLKQFSQVVLSVDLALDSSVKSNYSAYIVLGKKIPEAKLSGNQQLLPQYYVLDFCRGKFGFVEMIETFKKLEGKYQKLRKPYSFHKIIEKTAAGSPLIDYLIKNDNIPCLHGITPKRNKQERLISIQPIFANNSLFFPHLNMRSDIEELTSELLAFPSGKNDDYVDALSQGLTWLFYDRQISKREVLQYSRELEDLPVRPLDEIYEFSPSLDLTRQAMDEFKEFTHSSLYLDSIRSDISGASDLFR
jgi:predicted phage terminase large subunit-like protein